MVYHQSPILAKLATSLVALAVAAPAVAQQQPSPQTASAVPAQEHLGDDDYHGEIVVTAQGVGRLDFLAGTDVMQGAELQRNLDGQVGEVLEGLPGVSASGFAPGASRPVLRGFSGERVRVLTDGIGSIDASNTSADHAVTIDPLTADRIEVLRGPAVLLYGSSAIGGAVNVIDKRIPLRIPEEPVHVDGVAAVDTVSDLKSAGASADFPVGGRFVAHVDASWRQTEDLGISGYAASGALRSKLLTDAAEEEDEGHLKEAEELREIANLRGFVPNSGAETYSAGTGLVWIGDRGDLGLSVGYYDTFYGVPLRPGAGHHHEEEDAEDEAEHEAETVSIGLKQWRGDLRGRLEIAQGPFAEIRTRWGYSDYTHTEFEGDEVGTTFDVAGVEGRLELVQDERGGWRGTVGGQFYHRDFVVVGAEAFVPPNTTDQYALFALQEFDLGPVTAEAAGRWEHTDVATEPAGLERSFDTFSGAVGLWHETPGGLRFGVNASRAERAPSAEELFADGPHPATQQFEIGNPLLDTEKAWGIEAYLRGRIGRTDLAITAFRSWFDDFIYLAATGAEEDELPVFRQRQQGADHMGIEAELKAPLYESARFDLSGELSGSYIRATLADGSPVPFIPPLSARAALVGETGRFEGRLEAEFVGEQNRIAAFETPTDGFTMVDASLAWKPLRGDDNLTLLAQVENIFDVEGRRHASVTKDFVPLAGRNFKLSLRLSL